MRNIGEVIKKVKGCIPVKRNKDVIDGLDELQHDFSYKAPEQMTDCWCRLEHYLTRVLGPTDVKWKRDIQDIMADKEKVLVTKVQLECFNGPCIYKATSVEAILEEVKGLLGEDDEESVITLTTEYMDKKKFEGLKEFEGY